jgi:hypothetical protein
MFALYVAGVAEYEDIYGLRHKTEYCAMTGGPRLAAQMARAAASPDGKVTFASPVWLSCNRHNDAN